MSSNTAPNARARTENMSSASLLVLGVSLVGLGIESLVDVQLTVDLGSDTRLGSLAMIAGGFAATLRGALLLGQSAARERLVEWWKHFTATPLSSGEDAADTDRSH